MNLQQSASFKNQANALFISDHVRHLMNDVWKGQIRSSPAKATANMCVGKQKGEKKKSNLQRRTNSEKKPANKRKWQISGGSSYLGPAASN